MSLYAGALSAAGPSRLRTIFGIWRKSVPSSNPNAVNVIPIVEMTSPNSVSTPPPYSPHGYESARKEGGSWPVEEPPTLARMLLMYGFFFFPFWMAGIYILCSPLLPTLDWEAGKTEAEKAQLLHLLRETEKKWAQRCLYAMFGLIVTMFLLVIIIKYGIMRTI